MSDAHQEVARIRMAAVDAMPHDWRALVHDYGFAPVEFLRITGDGDATKARAFIERQMQGAQQERLEA